MPTDSPDHYTLLGIPRDADAAAIARACRLRLFEAHPDRHHTRSEPSAAAAAAAATRQLIEAREVLLDPVRRAAYDRTLPRARARKASRSATSTQPRASTRVTASAAPEPRLPRRPREPAATNRLLQQFNAAFREMLDDDDEWVESAYAMFRVVQRR
jgi:curved DNA-binding protein CbpA